MPADASTAARHPEFYFMIVCILLQPVYIPFFYKSWLWSKMLEPGWLSLISL